MFISILSFIAMSFAADDFSRDNWKKWKTETYKEHLHSETSFLNAVSLSYNTQGKSLYLNPQTDIASTKWEKTRLPGFHIKATHRGDKVTLTRPGHRDVVLSDSEGSKRRFHWTLKNGLIAEAVYSRTAKKVWGYIYNPNQIKDFTGFRFYPFNEKAVVQGQFKRMPKKSVSYKTVQGDLRKVFKIGEVTFTFQEQNFTLSAYNWQKEREEPNYLALIFSDTMAGKETYAGGREVVVKFDKGIPANGSITVDFNRTTNFYCAPLPFLALSNRFAAEVECIDQCW